MALCTLFVLAQPARASGQAGHGLALNWVRLEGAEDCISAAELMQRVETNVGRILFVRSGDAALSIDGFVRPVSKPLGWSVQVSVSTPQGEVLGRRDLGVLEGAACSVIDQAVAFLLQVTLDADGALYVGIPLSDEARRAIDDAIGGVSSDPDPQQLLAAAPEVEGRELSVSKPAPQPLPTEPTTLASQRALRLDLSLAAEAGQLPGLGFGVAAHAEQVLDSGWSIALGFTGWPGRNAVVQEGRAVLELFAASLLVCPLRFAALLSLCAGAEYGRLSARAQRFKFNAPTSNRASFAVLATGVLWLELWGPLALRGELGLAIPLLRNDYVFSSVTGVEHERELFGTAPVSARLELGLGLRL